MKSSSLSSTLFSKTLPLLRISSTLPYSFCYAQLKIMAHNKDAAESKSRSYTTRTTKVDKFQQVLQSDGGWEKCWEQGLTPWDLGQPTPVLEYLHRTGSLPKGRALIPGCGSGHDVVAIACPERYVVGLDISDSAIKGAIELSSSSPNANYFMFLKTDFFIWRPTELFDLIFDYTFFLPIEPDMRSAWASKIQDLLKPDGELITLMFPTSDHEGGPPYKVSVSEEERSWENGKGGSIGCQLCDIIAI